MAAPDYAALMEKHLAQAVAHILKPRAAGLSATELGRRWPQFLAALQESGVPGGMTQTESPPRGHDSGSRDWQAVADVLFTKGGDPAQTLPGCLAWGDCRRDLRPCLGARRPPQAVPDMPRGPLHEEAAALQDLHPGGRRRLQVYDQLCRTRGVLDFIAVEQSALRLLSTDSPAELLLRLDWRLRHILVDEFQDTSENQMNSCAACCRAGRMATAAPSLSWGT